MTSMTPRGRTNGYTMPSSEFGLPRSHAIHSPINDPSDPLYPGAISMVESDNIVAPIHESYTDQLVLTPIPQDQTRLRYAAARREPSSPVDIAAERSTLTWVNSLLGWIWPKANQALMQWVHEDLTPRLQEAFPAPFKKLHFSNFSLGKNTPDFGPVEVIQHSKDHVQLDLEIRYVSDCDIQIDAGTGGITFGINQLKFSGRLCIVFRPLVDKWPLVGAMKWFFCDKPRVSLRFTGLAALAHYPGMDTRMQRTVDEWIGSRIVLPNHRMWMFTQNEDIVDPMEAARHEALGILRARVRRGSKLAGVNWSALSVDRFLSDPYCTLSLGNIVHRSSTASNTTDPVWNTTERSGYFVVYHKDQGLEIEVLGDKSGQWLAGTDASLGRMPSTSVGHIMSMWPIDNNSRGGVRCHRMRLDTSHVSKELLHVNDPIVQGIPSELEVEVEWYNLTNRQGVPANGEHPMALLCVELHKGTGFPQEAFAEKKGLRWRSTLRSDVQLADAIVMSRRGQLCDVEQIEFPDIPIHPRLHPVIDRLAEKKIQTAEIAQIVGVDNPEVITLYLQLKAEYIRKHQDRIREQKDQAHRVHLQWYETLTHLLHRVETSSVVLDLLDGEDHVVGSIGPISLRELFSNSPMLAPRKIYSMSLPRDDGGGLASWFAPARPQGLDRFATVELQISARLQYLQAAWSLPKRSGSFLADEP